nr:thiamine phosphate synthase [Butyrivibrio sp. CB08]
MQRVTKDQLKLYLVTDSTGLSEEEFLTKVEAALQGGVTFLQIREKDRPTLDYIDLARKVHEISARYNVPLVVDDRVDVAMAIDAEGVHLGQSDMPVDEARKLLGDSKIIGATAKTVEQARVAKDMGADYIGVGAIYPTTTKVKTIITSVDTLRDICEKVEIPANAIGGLNKDNIDVLKGVPIAGICVVSAIMKAEDSYKATRDLLARMDELEIGKGNSL